MSKSMINISTVENYIKKFVELINSTNFTYDNEIIDSINWMKFNFFFSK